MKRITLLLLCLIFAGIRLCGKPVGLKNCGNTCFQNAFIQMMYQIDPLIDMLIVSKPKNLYTPNTLGYTFQHLVWDIATAQKNNKPSIGCGPDDNPTNLKKLTEEIYECMKVDVGRMGDAARGLEILLEKAADTSYEELISILIVGQETVYYPSGADPYVRASIKKIPSIALANLDDSKKLEGYIANNLVTQKSWKDTRTGIMHKTVDVKNWFLSAPKFILFFYSDPTLPKLKGTSFPDQLDLTQYIKGHSQALYQLRGIAVHKPLSLHYVAIVRDRDNQLYECNDDNITQVNTWQKGIGNSNPTAFLYVLKENVQTVIDSTVLVDKLNKLQQGLKDIEQALSSY